MNKESVGEDATASRLVTASAVSLVELKSALDAANLALKKATTKAARLRSGPPSAEYKTAMVAYRAYWAAVDTVKAEAAR